MIKNNYKNIIFNIGKKFYIGKIFNYLIVDFINKNIGTKIIIKKILFYNNIYNNNFIKLKINSIILKHFFVKSIVCKKKRRKHSKKKIFCYNKKSLIFLQNIF